MCQQRFGVIVSHRWGAWGARTIASMGPGRILHPSFDPPPVIPNLSVLLDQLVPEALTAPQKFV